MGGVLEDATRNARGPYAWIAVGFGKAFMMRFHIDTDTYAVSMVHTDYTNVDEDGDAKQTEFPPDVKYADAAARILADQGIQRIPEAANGDFELCIPSNAVNDENLTWTLASFL